MSSIVEMIDFQFRILKDKGLNPTHVQINRGSYGYLLDEQVTNPKMDEKGYFDLPLNSGASIKAGMNDLTGGKLIGGNIVLKFYEV